VRRSRDRASRRPARSSSCTARSKVRRMFRTNASASRRVQCVCRGFGAGKVPCRPGNRPTRRWSGVPSRPHVGRTRRCQPDGARGQRRSEIPCGASRGAVLRDGLGIGRAWVETAHGALLPSGAAPRRESIARQASTRGPRAGHASRRRSSMCPESLPDLDPGLAPPSRRRPRAHDGKLSCRTDGR
jgi:hypothetical protein